MNVFDGQASSWWRDAAVILVTSDATGNRDDEAHKKEYALHEDAVRNINNSTIHECCAG
jgi:hypothetical protein